MAKKFSQAVIYLIALTVVSTVGAILIKEVLAAWTGPTANPPSGNITPVNSGWTVAGTNVSLTTLTDLVGIGTATPNRQLHIYQTAGNNAEIDLQSVAGANQYWALYQDRATGELRFWNNNVTSTSTKNAFVITSAGYLQAATPLNASDVATKGYVDAAAGGGDATLANQNNMMGFGFASSTDSLRALNVKISAIPTSGGDATYAKQVEIANILQAQMGWVLANQTYYSVGGNTNFCRQNAVNGSGVVVVTSINDNSQCDLESGVTWRCTGGACVKGLTYTGGTHTEQNCTTAGGAVASDDTGKTMCKFSGTGISCPSGWTQADNWQRYSPGVWGGDGCGYNTSSGPATFANQQATVKTQSGYVSTCYCVGAQACGSCFTAPSCGGASGCSSSYWNGVSWGSGYNSLFAPGYCNGTQYQILSRLEHYNLTTQITNTAANRVEIGCK